MKNNVNKVLVVIDMQNDFINGALGSIAAQNIVDKIANFVAKWEGRVIFTRDTHDENYLNTREGKYLSVKHCIQKTVGWEINQKIYSAASESPSVTSVGFVNKSTFGAGTLLNYTILECGNPYQIVLCGVCTDIYVISNALKLRSDFSETDISVFASMCAGLTPEKHEAALEVMRSCQIEVIK